MSNTSDKCDDLRHKFNAIRGKDLSTHMELVALETFIKEVNRGQGLGFTVFGIVIDRAMVNRIFSTL
eukprot:SAG31_NODE_10693_length_1109_cov_1.017822_1_plen_66_part_10